MKQLSINHYSDILLRNVLKTGNQKSEIGLRCQCGTASFFGASRDSLRSPCPKISLGRITRTICIVLLLCLGEVTSALAQRPIEKIETARIAFLTERLSLTPETAQQFWPVYNQWDEQRRELKREEFKLRRSGRTDELNDEMAQEHIDEYFSLKERQLDLEKEMATELSKVLSSTQMLQLIRAEADFQRTILRKLGERRRSGQRPGGR